MNFGHISKQKRLNMVSPVPSAGDRKARSRQPLIPFASSPFGSQNQKPPKVLQHSLKEKLAPKNSLYRDSLILDDKENSQSNPPLKPKVNAVDKWDLLAESELMSVEDRKDRKKGYMNILDVHQFLQRWPEIEEDYEIECKVGEGTFSAVYKAIDLRHHLYDNSSWSELIKITDKFRKVETQRDTVGETTKGTENVVVGRKRKRTASEDSTTTRHVALKRIFQQSGEKRIIGEIQLLSELGAHPNIVSLITVHRKDDQFCLVMPYFEHMEFRDYYLKMPFYEMKYYFRSLFNALVHIHSHKILHRDIKPANFLYNPKARHGVLADFGLAQKQKEHSSTERTASTIIQYSENSKSYQKVSVNRATVTSLTQRSFAARLTQGTLRHKAATRPNPRQPVPTSTSDAEISTSSDVPSKPNIIELRYGKPGYLKKDIRPSIKANRAGTRGFRAPEVLMKVKDQTTAVDIWSVGVILLCFLTRRFPFFQSNSDTEAFCELAIIFGEQRMKECAAALGRHLEMSVPTVSANGISWSTLIYNLNVDEYFQVPKQAVELLDRCLTLNPTQRITAEEALQSDWLRED